MAAPVAVALATGSNREDSISELYGGKGDTAALADPVYNAIGQVQSFCLVSL